MGRGTDSLDRKTPLQKAARALLAERLAEVRRHQKQAAARSPDAVHDMRVACRRLRVALQLLAGDALQKQARGVKALQDALGAVRDGHVRRGWIASIGVDRIERKAVQRDREAARALDAALRTFRKRTARTLDRRIDALERRGRLGGKETRRALAKALRRLRKRLREAKRGGPEEAHQLRIAAKRVRYMAELLAPALPDAVKPLLDEIEGLQDALGELHDADARLPLLREELSRAPDDDVPALLSALSLLYAERDELASAARAETKRWRKKKLAQAALAAL